MDRTEEVLVGLFSRLREDLREEPGVSLALEAQGRDVTLRIRSEKQAGNERQPYFAVVVGAAERDGVCRVSYNSSGTPSDDRQITIVGADSTEELLGLVRRYVEGERRRLIDHRRRT